MDGGWRVCLWALVQRPWVGGVCTHPSVVPLQPTELCWYHLKGGTLGDILGSSSSALEGADSEVIEHNFASRESERCCT